MADAHDDQSDSDSPQDRSAPASITKFVDIPKVLHSVEKDGPFDSCISCGADLLTSNRYYVIEKVIRRKEVIIEMAMCLHCRGDQSEEGMSEASAKVMHEFLQDKIDFHRRIELMSTVNDSTSTDPWFERCLLLDQPAQLYSEYQLVGLCKGPWLQRDFYPALISSQAVEEMAGLLSKETKDWMDDFIGDNFGMPSEFCQPPTFSPVLL